MPRHNQPAAPRQQIKSVALLLALAILGVGITAAPASAQDAKALMQTMMSTYRRLTSYEGQANATIRQRLPDGRTVTEQGFSTSFLYQSPNKLKLSFTLPRGGRTLYYDGTSLTLYESRSQTFATTAVRAANLQQLCAILQTLGIADRFDPLYFLAGNGLPADLTHLKRLPDQVRNGRPVAVVTGIQNTRTETVAWTWMIDPQTHLLAKVEGRTTNAPNTIDLVQKNLAVRKARVDRTVSQNVIAPKANGRIDPGAFTFHTPAIARKMPFPAAILKKIRSAEPSPTAKAR